MPKVHEGDEFQLRQKKSGGEEEDQGEDDRSK